MYYNTAAMAQKGTFAAGVDRKENDRTYFLFLLVSKATCAIVHVGIESSRSPSVCPSSVARAVIRGSAFGCVSIIGIMSVRAVYN